MSLRGARLLLTGEHPGQLLHPTGVVERDHIALGHAAVLGLGHHQVPVGVRRHLRQVGDDEHLGDLGQPGQPAADLHRGAAADPGVDLVEDEGRDRVRPGEHHLQREHHPGQLAAGGTARQWPRRRSVMRAEQQLYLVDPVPAEGNPAAVAHQQARLVAAGPFVAGQLGAG